MAKTKIIQLELKYVFSVHFFDVNCTVQRS
jgi:hypothetical protein